MTLRPATSDDRPAIEALLAGNALPVQDLPHAAIDFLVAEHAGDLVGVVGLETHGQDGLLRSLAVHDAHRRAGVGSALVTALEARAQAQGLSNLVLLTQTAEAFFARRGYAVIAREAAPAAVRDSGEFRSLCPASAICMQRGLT